MIKYSIQYLLLNKFEKKSLATKFTESIVLIQKTRGGAAW